MADTALDLLNKTQVNLLKKYDGVFSRFDDKAKKLIGTWQSLADKAENFLNTAHSSVKFKVEGDRKHFYPVIIKTSYQPFNFFISRDSVHWDSNGYGRCVIQINGLTTHWGHGANFTRVITNNHSRTRFLARAYEERERGWIVLYLRGDTTYRFISDWGDAKLGDYSVKNKKWVWSSHKEQWIEFRSIDDGTGTTYQDKFKNNWIMDLTKGGCYGVARKSGGKIIDTKNR